MDRFGLIGHPIAHSSSPALFSAAYGGRYVYDLIQTPDFGQAWARFLAEYKAINVTAPFKGDAFARADWKSPECERVGATNLVVKTPEGTRAYNSDYLGVKSLLEPLGRGSAAVIGYGGAGKAAALAAAEMGYATTVMNRTSSKAEKFVEGLPEYGFRVAPVSSFREELRKADLLIYALPMALESFAELVPEDFSSKPVVLEANYRAPAFSGLLRARMLDAGAQYLPGGLWLVNQAVSGYSVMTGETPDIEALVSL